MWQPTNENPTGRWTVGDCAVRAVAVALDTDWETAYVLMAIAGFLIGDMPSSDSVWGSVLREHNFQRRSLPDSLPSDYTVRDFAIDNPEGVYVLGTGTHAVAIVDGLIYDSFNSSNEHPKFVWFKGDK